MNDLARKIFRLTAIFGVAAVVIGAFGAHGLKSIFLAQGLDTAYLSGIYEKGVQYQFYHTLALGLAGVLALYLPADRWLHRAGRLFTAGILLFSGSLYLLACRDVLPFPVGWAGPLTPLGGLCFIGGWLSLLAAVWEKPR